ncbi:BglG family transcription antiterminator [Tepidimicrobium xylanilyticum]|uniref:BglG family transcription antiterminator n=1 Tax=Tepidimicrobium xylanilyticum TaxID=1123352 RepID=UPI00264AC6C5|nr:BglG family transcription antiterminator [Tepidimicrobium xylanilyticum]GMG95271.1 transcriptional regulator ManR [Tepidimicrobium xylanilyticum]
MNKREENLIRMLYENKNTFIVIREMAEHEGCSDKTIRNTLDRIEEYLSKFSSDLKLERVRGKGIRLKVKENSRLTLEDILNSDYFKEDILPTNERRFELAYILLMETEPVTLEELADRYYINKNTITDDLTEIGKQFQKFNLKIVSKQKIGTFVEGAEKDKREALSYGIKKLGELNKIKPTLKSIFKDHEIDLITKAIMDLQNHIGIYFTDESSNALAIHLLFMVKRIKLNQAISISKEQADLVKKKPQYSWALKLTKYLEKNFSIIFPENEIIYLTVHLLGMRYFSGSDMESIDFAFQSDTSIMDVLLNRLLSNMEKTCGIPFKSDEILIRGLKLHLYGSLNRIRYGLSLENPLFEEIKRMNPYIYYETLATVNEFNSDFNINIPREEVAYIAVHFQASIERHNDSSFNRYTAVVVCHLGVGISSYLQIKLEKLFPWMTFIGNVSVKDVRKYVEDNPTDFIFSTVDLDDFKIQYIKISSIIDKTEEIRIREIVNESMIHNDLSSQKKGCKFIDNEFIFLQQNFKSKEEVIEFITSKLYKRGRIDSRFYQSVLERESMDTTEIGNLLAIPHGDSEYVISSTISILTLKKPILWDDEKVQIVFLLAVKKEDYSKDDTMKDFFKYLNNLSSDQKLLEQMVKENNISKFIKLLN